MGNNFTVAVCAGLRLFRLLSLSLKSSLNQDEMVAGKGAVTVVDRGEPERMAQTANQLVPTSPVAKKHSADRPIRTESTENVTDWENRTEGIGFLSILITEVWENTDLIILSDHIPH